MKKLSIFYLTSVAALAFVGAAFAADPVVVQEAIEVVANTTTPQASVIDWFRQNTVLILGIFLAVSELLGASPWFKGNGVIDVLIKSLKFLMGKTPAGS